MILGVEPDGFWEYPSAAMWTALIEYFIILFEKLQTFFKEFQTFKASMSMRDESVE